MCVCVCVWVWVCVWVGGWGGGVVCVGMSESERVWCVGVSERVSQREGGLIFI